jgi:hypothetical protein
MEKDKHLKIWIRPYPNLNIPLSKKTNKEIIKEIIGKHKPVKNPTFNIYFGLPGSGKSTIMNNEGKKIMRS